MVDYEELLSWIAELEERIAELEDKVAKLERIIDDIWQSLESVSYRSYYRR